MDAQDYHQNFYFTSLNVDVMDQHLTYFAMFDIEMTGNNYHREKITITSSEDQIVHISVNTYDTQHIRNGDCDKFREGTKLWWMHSKQTAWNQFADGKVNHAAPEFLKSGESLTIHLALKWVSQDLAPHDFSVVIWAENSPVTM